MDKSDGTLSGQKRRQFIKPFDTEHGLKLTHYRRFCRRIAWPVRYYNR